MTGTESEGQAPVPTTQPKNPAVGYKDGTFYRRGKPMPASERMDRYSQFDEAMLVREQRDISKSAQDVAQRYFASGDKNRAVSEIDSLRSKHPNQSRYIDVYGSQILGVGGDDRGYKDFVLQQEQSYRRNPAVKRARQRVAARKAKV